MTLTPPTVWELILLAWGGLAAWALFALRLHRLSGAPKRPYAFSPITGGALFFSMLLIGPAGAAVAARLLSIQIGPDMPIDAQTQLVIGYYLAQCIVLGLFIWLQAQARKPMNDNRRSSAAAILVGLGGLALFWPMAAAAGGIASWVTTVLRGTAVQPIAHETLALLLQSDRDVWFFTLVALVTIAAPVLEEVLYRGTLQETLRRTGLGPWAAITATSTVFALMHFNSVDPWALPALFVLSLGFGWALERTGRLIASIVMHILFNIGNIVLAVALY